MIPSDINYNDLFNVLNNIESYKKEEIPTDEISRSYYVLVSPTNDVLWETITCKDKYFLEKSQTLLIRNLKDKFIHKLKDKFCLDDLISSGFLVSVYHGPDYKNIYYSI